MLELYSLYCIYDRNKIDYLIFFCLIFSFFSVSTPTPPQKRMDRFDLVADVLPENKTFKLRQIKTKRRKCRRLIYRPNKSSENQELDRVETHLFTLSHNDVDIYALEAFIYESEEDGKRVNTLFISKADTTGYNDEKVSITLVTTAIIHELMRHYVNVNGNPEIVRICLFAKADKQYLFPLSSENPDKHVLWDTKLVKWWCKVLEPLTKEFKQLTKARLQIPGSDEKSIKSCFPEKSNLPWQVGDIFWADDGTHNGLSAVRCIPRFPDDPKSRFLDFLVAGKRAKKTSREQFWIELQARQEFRLGSVVGIIGLEGSPSVEKNLEINIPHSVQYKKFKTFRDILVSSDYSKREYAIDAGEQLDGHTPASSVIMLTGKMRKQIEKKKAVQVQTPQANVLTGSIIRKKKK